MKQREKTLNSNLIFTGKVVKLKLDTVLCPNGQESTREVIMHNGGACVLVVVNGKVLLEKQYRYPYDEVLYEIPAGKLELNENPYDACMRELEEETGYKTDKLIDLGILYPACGYSNEVIYMYATDKIEEGQLNLDADEIIDVEFIDLKDVHQMILDNKIVDSKTICALYKYELLNK